MTAKGNALLCTEGSTHFKSDLTAFEFRDTCSLCALLSIVATLCVGLEQDSLKAAILVMED